MSDKQDHEVTHHDRLDGHGRGEFWTTCTCGWESEIRFFPSEAHRDATLHLGRRA